MKIPHRTAAALLAAALLAGCAQTEKCAPGAQEPAPSVTAAASKKPSYTFGLPGGDRSVDANLENALYVELDRGDCGAADTILKDGYTALPDLRDVYLFRAAIALCRKNTGAARREWDKVDDDRGRFPARWVGVSWRSAETFAYASWHVCELYRSVASTLGQKSRDKVTCSYRKDTDPGLSGDEQKWFDNVGREDLA
ncbi:MAG: hypothetical protein HOV79_17555 [Hamadaea sp.]|nr:hypothetical protein [Hamadaea sp.]